MTYFDTSAFASLFVPDVHTVSVQAFVARPGSHVRISDLTAAEFSSVLSRNVRMRQVSEDGAREVLDRADRWIAAAVVPDEVLPADIRVADAHVRNFALGLRAPDAIHIAICQRLGLGLATCDANQAKAARALGVVVDDLSGEG